jgi:hypothetical protein
MLFAAFLWSCEQKSATAGASVTTVSNDSLIKRGAYLVTIVGCDDCHSPKAMGPHGPEIIQELRLSGFQASNQLPPVNDEALKSGWALMYPDITAAVGPWGTSYAANLTSDETGIGNWTEAQFMKAMKEGKWKGMDGNRMLMPPMPWPNFARMDDHDLKSIFAFLKSTKPVKNVVPNSVPAGPPPAEKM